MLFTYNQMSGIIESLAVNLQKSEYAHTLTHVLQQEAPVRQWDLSPKVEAASGTWEK